MPPKWRKCFDPPPPPLQGLGSRIELQCPPWYLKPASNLLPIFFSFFAVENFPDVDGWVGGWVGRSWPGPQTPAPQGSLRHSLVRTCC